jgi:hypothetical protein
MDGYSDQPLSTATSLLPSSRLREHPDRFIMSTFGCQHQGRLAFIILRFHVCLGDEQSVHNLIVAEPRRFN